MPILVPPGSNNTSGYTEATVVVPNNGVGSALVWRRTSDNALLLVSDTNALPVSIKSSVAIATTVAGTVVTSETARANTEKTIFASAARTTTQTSSTQSNLYCRGLQLFLDITATPNNAETLTVSILSLDPIGGTDIRALTTFPATPAASTLGAAPAAGSREFVYILYPGAVESVATTNLEVQGIPAPRSYQVRVTHSSAGSWTYALAATELI